MRFVGIAIVVMVVATVAVHLGLPQAIGRVIAKILACHKCLTFWLTIGVITFCGCPTLLVLLLSLFAAYTSNWFALLLVILNKLYDKLWEKVNK